MPRRYTLCPHRYEKSRARFRHKIEDVSEGDFKKALAAVKGTLSKKSRWPLADSIVNKLDKFPLTFTNT
jgi:hypothetical protein